MTENLKYSPCFQCRDPKNRQWEDIKTLKYALDTKILCRSHLQAAENKIKSCEPEDRFLPEIPKKEIKNYQDREPGEDD